MPHAKTIGRCLAGDADVYGVREQWAGVRRRLVVQNVDLVRKLVELAVWRAEAGGSSEVRATVGC